MFYFLFYRIAPIVFLIGFLVLFWYAFSDWSFNKKSTFVQFLKRSGLALVWPLAMLSPAGRKVLTQGFEK